MVTRPFRSGSRNETAAALEALGVVPETQWPGTEASTLEMSTDSEVTFRKVLGSAEVLATIDLEWTRWK